MRLLPLALAAAKATLQYLKDLDTEYMNLIRNVPCRVIVINAERPVEEIHEEICKHLSVNELLINNPLGKKVHEKGGRGREVHCTPFPNMCRLS